MATSDKFLQRGVLTGETDVPLYAFPTIRARIRRNDPDFVRAFPYYPSLSGTSLTLATRTAPGGGTTPYTINFTSDGYDDAIIAVNAISPSDIMASDGGGFLVISSMHEGDTNTLEIVSGDAATILGFDFAAVGGFSQAGDIADASPGGVNQSNPHLTRIVAHDEKLTSAVVNRAIVGSLQGLDQLIFDLIREQPLYHSVNVIIPGTAFFAPGLSGLRLALDPLGGLATDAGFDQLIHLTKLDGTEVYDAATGNTRVKVTSITYGPLVDASVHFVAWGTPDGKSITKPRAPGTTPKTSPTAITEIRGNLIKAPGSLFITNRTQVNDIVAITGATNTSPFSHNGNFVILEIIDEDTIFVRPMGSVEAFETAFTLTPRALNQTLPPATAYGDVSVLLGDFVSISMKTGIDPDVMYFNLNAAPANATYRLTFPRGATLRETAGHNLLPEFIQKDDQLAYLNKANQFILLNRFKKGVQIGESLVTSSLPQTARTQYEVATGAVSSYTLLEATNVTTAPGGAIARHYAFTVDAPFESTYLVWTLNCSWDGTNWTKDEITGEASKLTYNGSRFIMQHQSAAYVPDWNDSQWETSSINLRSTIPSSATEAEVQALLYAKGVAAATTAFTLMLQFECQDGGGLEGLSGRVYCQGLNGDFVITTNANWSSGAWHKDIANEPSTQYCFRRTGLYVRYKNLADNTAWDDTVGSGNKWSSETLTLDPIGFSSLSRNIKLGAGFSTLTESQIPRLLSESNDLVALRTMQWQGTADNSVAQTCRMYFSASAQYIEFTENAQWIDTPTFKWHKDVSGTKATLFRMTEDGIFVFSRLAANNTDWADNSWDLSTLLGPDEKQVEIVPFVAALVIAPAGGNTKQVTLTANITSFSINAARVGDILTVEFIQGGTGGYTLAVGGGNVKLAGGALALTAAVGSVDSLMVKYVGGSVWHEIGRALDVK